MKKGRREDRLGISKMFSNRNYPPLLRPAFMGYGNLPSAQQQRCISKQVINRGQSFFSPTDQLSDAGYTRRAVA